MRRQITRLGLTLMTCDVIVRKPVHHSSLWRHKRSLAARITDNSTVCSSLYSVTEITDWPPKLRIIDILVKGIHQWPEWAKCKFAIHSRNSRNFERTSNLKHIVKYYVAICIYWAWDFVILFLATAYVFVYTMSYYPLLQGSWGQHGAHLGTIYIYIYNYIYMCIISLF